MRFTLTTQQQPNTVEVLAIIFDDNISEAWCKRFIAQLATGEVWMEQDALPGCGFDYRKPIGFGGLGDFMFEFQLGVQNFKLTIVPLAAIMDDDGELDPDTKMTVVAANKELIH